MKTQAIACNRPNFVGSLLSLVMASGRKTNKKRNNHLSAIFFDVMASSACADDPRFQVAQLGQLELGVAGADRRAKSEFAFRREARLFVRQEGATGKAGRRLLALPRKGGINLLSERERELVLGVVLGRSTFSGTQVLGCRRNNLVIFNQR